MAIQDDDTGSQSQNTVTQAPRQQAQQPRQATQQPAPAMSFHSGGLFAAPISRTVGSEVYSKLKENLVEIYKNSDEKLEIALIDLDNVNEPALAFSSIVVAVRMKDRVKAGIAYHILMLEATGDKLNPIFENISSQQIEVLRVTSDAIDDVLMKRAQDKVQRHFPNGPWRFCDATIVPAHFNADDKHATHQLALNAGLACTTELEICTEGFVDLNLTNIANDSTLNVNIAFNRNQIADAVGNPMRSDILLNFSSKRNSNGGKYASVNSGDKEVKVYEASAFTDVIWSPVNPQSAYNAWVPQQQVSTQKYIARLVVTNLASQISYTPASVLLALVAAQTVREENNWIQTFRPMATGNEIDMSDIGALNIEANVMNEPSGFGTRIDTKSNDFKLADLGKLVAALFQPGMVVSLDCPEYGPQAWYTSVFAHAANGSQRAQAIIYDAANQLTGGNFGKHFPTGSTMFADLGNRVHLGTWTDRQGNKRDIRDIDHIAVCNLAGERNPQAIRDWSDTFLRTQFPLIQRLAARKKMISGLTGETATFTGFAQRVTFSRAFMDALNQGVRETNLAVRINTPLTGSDFNDQRGVANFASAALMAPSQTFMNAGGFGGYQQQFNQGVGGGNFRY